ncbi:ABC transporter substrate-binding protein [Micromonospora chalcea]|uniref:ABC transporter substrate-binding protein n=1 Tax=Micromonospora chalcea TaxID=1874 RepID=UPI0033DECD23
MTTADASTDLGLIPGADRPRRGGTLTLVGAGDVDHLDPALAYHTVTRGIVRAYTRQLVTYPSTRDHRRAGDLVPDLAVAADGPYDAEGRRYRFTLRDGLRWDLPNGPRPLTAADVVRGIKRLAHPMAPSPGLPYYLSTVEGLAEFRDDLLTLPRDLNVVAPYLEAAEVPGLRVLDDRTVELTTRRPTSDFLNLLALPFASPAPEEYLWFVPGSPELDQRLGSIGPYRITAYEPDRLITLERSRTWDPATDPVRAAHVDRIEVRQGLDEKTCHDMVILGDADMLWDIQPLTERLPEMFAAGDPRLEVCPAGLFSPYLVINVLSPNEGGALGRREVREALQYAIDKTAVAEVWGGRRLNDIAEQILPPLCRAHRPFAPYAANDGAGDPELARRLLADAGYPDGLTLKLVYRDRDIHPETARVVRSAAARAGITLDLVPAGITELFGTYLGRADGAREGRWDVALSGWEPDWHGNNARVYLQALFDSSGVSGNDDWGSNFGHYRNEVVNEHIDAALSCADERAANEHWRAAEREVLRDCAVVPILFAHQYWLRGHRVRNWLPYPVLNGDLTNLWLGED